jgi:hypothetical protein
MSKTTLYDVRADGKALVIVTGRFAHPTTVSSGLGFTVVDHATAGRYDITFDDQYSGFISCVVSLEGNTVTDIDGWTVNTSTYTAGANPTLSVYTMPPRIVDAAAPVTTDLAANCFCNFIAVFRNTTVTK